MQELMNKVKAYKKSQVSSAAALRKAGAPVWEVNSRVANAANAVSLFESFVCFTNMAAANAFGQKAQHEQYAAQYMAKLNNLLNPAA